MMIRNCSYDMCFFVTLLGPRVSDQTIEKFDFTDRPTDRLFFLLSFKTGSPLVFGVERGSLCLVFCC